MLPILRLCYKYITTMNNIVKFCARGTNFVLPNILLNKYPETMLSMLSNNMDIPIDKIDGSIYVDISPYSINYVIDYYNLDKCEVKDFYTLMDFKYLGLENYTYSLPFSYAMSNINNCEIASYGIGSTVDISKYKYCRIHTADCKIIVISVMLYGTNNLNALSSMLHIFTQDDVDRTDLYTDARIGVSERITNILLSIIRDGVMSYYGYLTYNYLQNNNSVFCEYKINSDSIHVDATYVDTNFREDGCYGHGEQYDPDCYDRDFLRSIRDKERDEENKKKMVC